MLFSHNTLMWRWVLKLYIQKGLKKGCRCIQNKKDVNRTGFIGLKPQNFRLFDLFLWGKSYILKGYPFLL